jgi:hypothetical protein
LRRQGGDQSIHAGAHQPILVVAQWSIDLALKILDRPVTRVAAAIKIDNGPSKDSIEPRLGALLVADLVFGPYGFELTLLYRIGAEVGIPECLRANPTNS